MYKTLAMLALFAIFCTASCKAEKGAQPEASAALARINEEFKSGDYGNVDRLLILHNGETIADYKYNINYHTAFDKLENAPSPYKNYSTRDPFPYNYNHPDWHPYYQGSDLHSLQSVTKSITSIIIGIAIARGDIPSVDTPIIGYLEKQYDIPHRDSRLEAVTLHHLLSMQMNLAWDEISAYDNEENPVVQLELSDNWAQYVLTYPMENEPGSSFSYNSGATQLLAAILREATGVDIDEYARRHLFTPLNITNYYWKKTPSGMSDAIGGLYLRAEDLAKIGALMMHGGLFGGERILPEAWVKASFTPYTDDTHIEDGHGDGYGYQWWLPIAEWGDGAFMAQGYGGQILLGLPESDLIVVMYGWNILFDGTIDPTAPFSLVAQMLKSDVLPAISE